MLVIFCSCQSLQGIALTNKSVRHHRSTPIVACIVIVQAILIAAIDGEEVRACKCNIVRLQDISFRQSCKCNWSGQEGRRYSQAIPGSVEIPLPSDANTVSYEHSIEDAIAVFSND